MTTPSLLRKLHCTYLKAIMESDGRKVLDVIEGQIELLQGRKRPDAVKMENPARRKPQDSKVRQRAPEVSKGREGAPPLQAKLLEQRH